VSSATIETPAKAGASRELGALRALLVLYIVLCIAIAGLNYGVARRADAGTAAAIGLAWRFYENVFKTALIAACSILTLRIVDRKGHAPRGAGGGAPRDAPRDANRDANRDGSRMRRNSLMALFASALVLHVVSPLATGNWDLYFVGLPLPWTSVGLQLAHSGKIFDDSFRELLGLAGIQVFVAFFVGIQALSWAGTAFLGRRWQCSMTCLFNGFAAEIFAPAMPLLGRKGGSEGLPARIRPLFRFLKRLFLAVGLGISGVWAYVLVSGAEPGFLPALISFESLKYLAFELMMTMAFWVALRGRAYCHYCPAGTVAGWIGKACGQRITVAHSKCVGCGACDRACPMSVPIMEAAGAGRDIASADCVGCGRCVEACPTANLRYSTAATRRLGRESF
jgi:ferredoxin-type protein NapH